ncbi:MAG TPA: putative nucleotidyltransferase substrate binding domain-containing protein [Aldersonia sp.]
MSDFDAVIAALGGAEDDDELCAAFGTGRDAVIAALSAHLPALTLAHGWTDVVRTAVTSAARIVAGRAGTPPGWHWHVSGSTGRGEALPGSDLDSLLVLDDGADPALVRLAAAEVHVLLERCGLPADDNGALASRARFCRTSKEWLAAIDGWSTNPRVDRGVVMLGLISDAEGLDGPGPDGLRAELVDRLRAHPQAMTLVLQDATIERASVPSRLRIFASGEDVVDLKAALLEPIVKIARWTALRSRSTATSTTARLVDATADPDPDLSGDDAQMLLECFAILTRLRWRTRAKAWLDGSPVTDRVALSQLSPQDRATLRSVAREVAGVRRKLGYLAAF